jgi:hypothetical protein
LPRDVLGAGDRGEIADDDGLGLRNRLPGVVGAGIVARVQDDLMALIGEKPADHQTEAVRGTGD